MQIDYILTGVYLLASLQGVILFLGLLTTGARSNKANLFLAILIALITLFVARKVFYTSGLMKTSPFLVGLLYPLLFTFGPLLYFYAKGVAGKTTAPLRRIALHLTPMLITLAVNLPIILMSTEEKLHYVQAVLFDPTYTLQSSELLTLLWGSGGWLHFALYCLMVIGLLRQHGDKIRNEFSSLERISLNWLRTLSGFCLASGLVGFLLSWGSLLQGHPLANPTTRFIELLLILLIYVVGYMGFLQPTIFRPQPRLSGKASALAPAATEPVEPTAVAPESVTDSSQALSSHEPALRNHEIGKYEKSSLTEGASEIYKEQLLTAIAEQELFLDNSLTLTALAIQLDIPHHHLSQVINGSLGMNFFEFVNNYRIEFAKKLLNDSEHNQQTVIDIAMASGFNNKTSFYKAFKGATGITPSQYRKQQAG